MYEYIMTRTPQTVPHDNINVGYKFKKVFNQVREKAWKNHNIDMDIMKQF
jgi:hypothetical protein